MMDAIEDTQLTPKGQSVISPGPVEWIQTSLSGAPLLTYSKTKDHPIAYRRAGITKTKTPQPSVTSAQPVTSTPYGPNALTTLSEGFSCKPTIPTIPNSQGNLESDRIVAKVIEAITPLFVGIY
jgi:hypothetical protein